MSVCVHTKKICTGKYTHLAGAYGDVLNETPPEATRTVVEQRSSFVTEVTIEKIPSNHNEPMVLATLPGRCQLTTSAAFPVLIWYPKPSKTDVTWCKHK